MVERFIGDQTAKLSLRDGGTEKQNGGKQADRIMSTGGGCL